MSIYYLPGQSQQLQALAGLVSGGQNVQATANPYLG